MGSQRVRFIDGKQAGRMFAGIMLLLSGVVLLQHQTPTRVLASSNETPTYLGDNARDGFNSGETLLNVQTAPTLQKLWQYPLVQGIGPISVEPTLVNNILYWGSWNGYEHATDLNGNLLWQTKVGKTAGLCNPPSAGPSGTATVATIPINGVNTPVVFLPGGDTSFYALNAATGAVIWRTPLGTPPNYRIWAGAAVFNGYVYVGVSSWGDCPLVRGALYQLNAATGAIVHTLYTVPNGCVGGGIWDQPAIDEANHLLYVTTGTLTSCSAGHESLAYAILKVDTDTLALLNSWQLPGTDQIPDSDFGSTPTLFNATINGTVHQMVGAINKNGYYYALDRNNWPTSNKNYTWKAHIASPGLNSKSSISSSAFDGTYLYVEGSTTTINGQACGGSVRALDPATGNFIWQYCASGQAVGGVIVTPRLVIAEAGTTVLVLNSQMGALLWSFSDGAIYSNSWFWGAATVYNGVIYTGNRDGILYAFGIQGIPTVTPSITPTSTPTITPSPTVTPSLTPTM